MANNKNQLLAVKKLNGISWGLGAGRTYLVVTDPTYECIKANILGRSSTLGIAVTVNDGYVGIFVFPNTVLKNDPFLRAMLFGRKSAGNRFVASNAIVAQLCENYISYCTNVIAENNFNFDSNCGCQFEDIAINLFFGKKTTQKMDKRYKVDVVANHRNIQLKCSLKHQGTSADTLNSYSYSKTNGKAKR